MAGKGKIWLVFFALLGLAIGTSLVFGVQWGPVRTLALAITLCPVVLVVWLSTKPRKA